MRAPDDTAAPTMPGWPPREHCGWAYLLPQGRRRHLVCLDDRDHSIAALQVWCEQLTVICPTRERAAAVAALPRTSAVARLRAVAVGDLPAWRGPEPAIDGLVGNLITCPWLSGADLERLAADLKPCLGGAVFVLLMVPNRLDYRRLAGTQRRHVTGTTSSWPWRLRSLVRRFGFAGQTRVDPLIVDAGRVIEVLRQRGYESRIEYPNGRERLRELVLGGYGARLLGNAMAIVAAKEGRLGTSLLDGLLAHVEDNLGADGDSEAALRRFLVLRSKSIFEVPASDQAPKGRGRGTVIAVPGQRQGWAGCVNEMRSLRRLAAESSVASQVPRVLGSGEYHSRSYAVFERIPGVVVDGRVADLELLTEQAADFISRLHTATSAPVRLDDGNLAVMLGDLIESARCRHPMLAADVADLGTCLWDLLRSQEIPAVMEHGDFKIENIVIDPTGRRLRAVIDWELSSGTGLPLLDLLYLLVYNHMFEPGETFASVCRRVVLADSWGESELALINRYLASVPLAPRLRLALGALFPLHSLARRFYVDPEDSELVGDWRDLLRSCARVVRQIGAHVALTEADRTGRRPPTARAR